MKKYKLNVTIILKRIVIGCEHVYIASNNWQMGNKS